MGLLCRPASTSLTLGSVLLETTSLLLCAPVPSVALHESMPVTVPVGRDLDPKLSAAASHVLSRVLCEAGHLGSSTLCISVQRCDRLGDGIRFCVQKGRLVQQAQDCCP